MKLIKHPLVAKLDRKQREELYSKYFLSGQWGRSINEDRTPRLMSQRTDEELEGALYGMLSICTAEYLAKIESDYAAYL